MVGEELDSQSDLGGSDAGSDAGDGHGDDVYPDVGEAGAIKSILTAINANLSST